MATNNKSYIKLWKKKTLRLGKVTEFNKRLFTGNLGNNTTAYKNTSN